MLTFATTMADADVVLITGASSGFGRLMAETFGREGYRVFAGMRGSTGKNAKAREELEALASSGRAIEVVELDVTDDAEVEAAVAGIAQRAGQLDVLINNAGISVAALSECASLEQARRVFETNYFGPFRLCRAVLPHMRRRGSGFVVHVSSIAGRVALPNSALYSASKAALEMFGEIQHYELASLGIDVSIIEPGMYGTGILDKLDHGDDAARLAEYGELAGKIDQAIEIAKQYIADKRPDPQDVADEVLRLAMLPAGERPLRVLMGEDAAMLEPINAVTEPITKAMFKAFGFI
jgi:NAD(P)-dependent dehydrogenase (short-subunit alcohol dehydrogenase family)